MSQFTDRTWTSEDGLQLHFRDYPAAAEGDRLPVLCIPGLTRNARDFAALAEHLSPARRVLCPDLRGRGDSDYAKSPESYVPRVYLQDLLGLLAQEGIERFVAVGTSLGGLLTMMIAAAAPGRVAAAVINDIGPDIDRPGLDRIRGYVGQGRNFPTWMHAARAMQETQGDIFPEYDISQWLAAAKRTMTLGTSGRIVFDYDMKIAETFAADETATPRDLWPLYRALEGSPVLVVRGALSDLLSTVTVDRMQAEISDVQAVTVPAVGHTPTLDEPHVRVAIDALLARVA